MSNEIPILKVNKLTRLFKDVCKNDQNDRRIFFILGAGASVSSGIPSGNSLAKTWLQEMLEDEEKEILAWIEEKGIDQNNPALHYCDIFDRRYRHDEHGKFAFLEKNIGGKIPGYGYSVLAQILATTTHNVVITTNFDHLIEQSIYTFTHKTPLVCGHESLAHFARPSKHRPLIIKVHNDLLFGPKNEAETTAMLEKNWECAFEKLFSDHERTVLVVIGYGGNDGSLMGFLEKLPKLSNIYWCLFENEEPQEKIVQLLKQHEGHFIATDGFDKIMFRLQNCLELPDLSEDIIKDASQRAEDYKQSIQKLSEEIQKSNDPDLRKAQKEYIAKVNPDDWFAFELKAKSVSSIEECENIYKEGLIKTNYHPALMGNFANFLSEKLGNYDEAELFYRKSIEKMPTNATIIGNYALFLHKHRNKIDEAEQLYKNAIDCDPNNVQVIKSFAIFLQKTNRNPRLAFNLFRKAIEFDPRDSIVCGNFAIFIQKTLKNYGLAEYYFRKAIEIDPENGIHYGNFAVFLKEFRKDYKRAELQYQKALELIPNDANILSNYAQLLITIHQNNLARDFLLRALKNNPGNNTMIEIRFYQFANFPKERELALKELKRLINEGVRSPGWDFSPNIELAEKEGHPDLPLLRRLADIISNDAPADGL